MENGRAFRSSPSLTVLVQKNQAFVLQCEKELHDWLEPLIGKFFCCFRKEPFSAKKSSAHWNSIDKKEGKNEGNSEKVRSFFGRWRELTVLLF